MTTPTFHGSNVDLERRKQIEEEIILATHEQEKLLLEYDLLTDADSPESVDKALLGYLAALSACTVTGANATETKQLREIACRVELARLRQKEERIAFLRRAMDVVSSKISGLQTRANLLRAQIGMDGRAR